MIQWVYADERSLSILERSFFSLLHLVCRPYNRNILGRAFCVSSKLRKGYPSSKLTNYSAILCSFCSVLPSFSCFQMFQDQLGLLLLGIFQKIGFSLSPRKKKDFKKKIMWLRYTATARSLAVVLLKQYKNHRDFGSFLLYGKVFFSVVFLQKLQFNNPTSIQFCRKINFQKCPPFCFIKFKSFIL